MSSPADSVVAETAFARMQAGTGAPPAGPGDDWPGEFPGHENWPVDGATPVVQTVKRFWGSVVRIEAAGLNSKKQRCVSRGTGWLLEAPPLQRLIKHNDRETEMVFVRAPLPLVITNRHVYVVDEDVDAKTIELTAYFSWFDDNGDKQWRKYDLVNELVYSSEETSDTDGLADAEKNRLDFVALKFNVPESEAELAAMQKQIYSFGPFPTWEESQRVSKTDPSAKGDDTHVVIIGHPGGGAKRWSAGKLTAAFDSSQENPHYCTAQYEATLTTTGSSGSPVFFINRHLDGHKVSALHYRSGLGIMFIGAIAKSLREQMAKQVEKQMAKPLAEPMCE